ncbi:helix-turn-helix transcriptional regulator [Methanomethylovorans sp.]|uniref:helix-turn-helix transcriptional regulator n=1 Tax=Methanomethylovorans sp. TaxID=2758717 RepID=UPI00351C75A8
MKKALLDVIFASKKRKEALLLLKDGAREMEALLKSLGTSRQALLPQMKILEKHSLVNHSKDSYELTVIGKLIVEEISPLLNTIEVLDTDIDYWGTHELGFIPQHLLSRINELEDCEIINPSLTELYSIHKAINIKNKTSVSVYIVTSFLYPNFKQIFTEMFAQKMNVYFVVSIELLDKIKKEYLEDFEEVIKSKYFNFFVYRQNMDFSFFITDDHHILINLLRKDRGFDNKYILCNTRND